MAKLSNQELADKVFYLNYMKMAQAAKVEGLYGFGYCYENGKGIAKNEKMAFQWFLKAAEKDLSLRRHYLI